MDGINRDSYWTGHLVEGRLPDKQLSDSLNELLDQLAVHKDFFHRIRSEGGAAEFFVGWFFDGRNGGDIFEFDLQAKMAELGIDLSLDIYPQKD